MFYAHVSLAPRSVSYSGHAARVLSKRNSKSGRFGNSEKAVTQSQSQPQCGGSSNQRHPCGKRDSEETVQEASNRCRLSCDLACCSG
jgi:hypothetical protein